MVVVAGRRGEESEWAPRPTAPLRQPSGHTTTQPSSIEEEGQGPDPDVATGLRAG